MNDATQNPVVDDGHLEKKKTAYFKRMSSGKVLYNPKPRPKRWNGVAVIVGIGPADFDDD